MIDPAISNLEYRPKISRLSDWHQSLLPFLSTRYSAGLNGFTAEGDHLPLPVEDTAEVAEARAAFMAYMIELMAKQDQEGGNVQVEKIDDVAGSMDLAEFDEVSQKSGLEGPEAFSCIY